MNPETPRGTKAPRGRPPKTAAEMEAIRAAIKEAAARAFAEHGYHALSVEHILQHSGLSRPTFYRYFSNSEEVLDLVLKEANDRLLTDLQSALQSAPDAAGRIEAGLRAWYRWSVSIGPMLPSIYAVLHDESTLVATHGQRVRDAVAVQINEAVKTMNRPPLDAVQTETFMIGMEYLGYRYFSIEEEPGGSRKDAVRQAMWRLAIGMLGSRVEWSAAPLLAAQFDIKLD
jgi:AcrR family transcriptional regulator